MSYLRAAVHGCGELLAPHRCAGCELPLTEHERGFCGGCEPLIEPAPSAFLPPALSAAAFSYAGPLAAAIQALKYRSRTEHAPFLGQLLAGVALAFAGQVDVVIPMALHPRRLRARGFNQAALLAVPVARALEVPLVIDRLKRVRETATQAGLTRADRAANLRGAFATHGDGRGQRVLLIDDVRTTGTTLAAAAEALLTANHSVVMTLALARTDL